MPRGVYDRSKLKKTAVKAVAKAPAKGPSAPRPVKPPTSKEVKAPITPRLTKAQLAKLQAEPKVMALSEVELLRMEKLSTQVRACDNEIIINQSLKSNFISQIDPAGQLQKFDSKLQALKQERMAAENEYKLLSKSIGDRYKIDMKEFAYDDQTGVLRRVAGEDVGEATTLRP